MSSVCVYEIRLDCEEPVLCRLASMLSLENLPTAFLGRWILKLKGDIALLADDFSYKRFVLWDYIKGTYSVLNVDYNWHDWPHVGISLSILPSPQAHHD